MHSHLKGKRSEEQEEEEEEVELTNILAARVERHGAPRAEQVVGSGRQDNKKTVMPVRIDSVRNPGFCINLYYVCFG